MLSKTTKTGIFIDSEVKNIASYLAVLKKIHTRMLIEGYTFENGNVSNDPRKFERVEKRGIIIKTI
jgi:hypothetical protein